MRVKKAWGSIYGAELTKDEQKAMNMEIQRQIAEYEMNHGVELEAMILWELHEQFGFGPKRLKRFHDNFAPVMESLIKRYEMDDTDKIWLCTRKLKEIGIDIKKWNREER